MTKKKEKKALQESIEHWERMIEWVELQPSKRPKLLDKMEIAINEVPNGGNLLK